MSMLLLVTTVLTAGAFLGMAILASARLDTEQPNYRQVFEQSHRYKSYQYGIQRQREEQPLHTAQSFPLAGTREADIIKYRGNRYATY